MQIYWLTPNLPLYIVNLLYLFSLTHPVKPDIANSRRFLYNKCMGKTKLIVKDNQVLVDADVLFEQIEEAGGNWKQVRESYDQLKASLQTDSDEE